MFGLLLLIYLLPLVAVIILLLKLGFWLAGKVLTLALWIAKKGLTLLERLFCLVFAIISDRVSAWRTVKGEGSQRKPYQPT